MILHWRRNVNAENKMTFKRRRRLLVRSLCSVVNASLLLRELFFKPARYLFQSLQLILHASIDSWCSDALMRQLFYHLCQSFHLSSEHQLVVSTFIELIKYLQLVQFLVYILRLDWILLQSSNTRFSLIRWRHINNAHHLLLMIRMKREHHVDDVFNVNNWLSQCWLIKSFWIFSFLILQLIQQNAENIKKKINAKQMTKNLQILQKMQVLQTSQVMQNSQNSTQKLTYVQKAAQVTSVNANANTNVNAGEWNLIIKKFSPKWQETSYCERKLIVNLKNEN